MNDVPPPWRGDMRDLFARTFDVREPPEPPHPLRFLNAALWFAGHGLPVFPLQPGTKLPYTGTNGVNDATVDQERIGSWWAYRPESNIGLATGHGVDAVDFDGPDGHAAWLSAHPDAVTWADVGLYVLATVHTPRTGGLHVYVPSNGRGNRGGMLGRTSHVDYRGLGGYVVAPTSHTPAGRYLWLDRLDPASLMVPG